MLIYISPSKNLFSPYQGLHSEADPPPSLGHFRASKSLQGSGPPFPGSKESTPTPSTSLLPSCFPSPGPRLGPSSLISSLTIQVHCGTGGLLPHESAGLLSFLLSKLFTRALSKRLPQLLRPRSFSLLLLLSPCPALCFPTASAAADMGYYRCSRAPSPLEQTFCITVVLEPGGAPDAPWVLVGWVRVHQPCSWRFRFVWIKAKSTPMLSWNTEDANYLQYP